MKRIVITGTSSGFGHLTAKRLTARTDLALCEAVRGGAARLATLGHESRTHGFALDLDLASGTSIEAFVAALRERWPDGLDVLINNAGFGLFGAIEDQPLDDLRRQMEINFFGTLELTKKLLPALRSRKGRVISVSSIAGRYAYPYYGAYCASKFALEAAMEALSYELEADQVQVCLIEPGGFRTDFSKNKVVAGLVRHGRHETRMHRLHRFMTETASRQGDANDVAKLIERFCFQPRLPLRRIIGKDAIGFHWLARLIPDAGRVNFIRWFFKKFVTGVS